MGLCVPARVYVREILDKITEIGVIVAPSGPLQANDR